MSVNLKAQDRHRLIHKQDLVPVASFIKPYPLLWFPRADMGGGTHTLAQLVLFHSWALKVCF